MFGNASTLDGDYSAELSLTRQDAANLRKAGKWGRFLGIVSMVFVGIFLILVVGFGGTMMTVFGLGAPEGTGVMMTIVLAFYAGILLLLFYLSYLLYKFGAEAVTAVDHTDARAVAGSLAALARLFKLYGILTIVYLAFTGVSLLTMLAAGAEAFIG
ncbi:hypothetical protein [Lewinella sp. JB7]|uniref:hypothetical protein n=1 Tax=Lewinella sp. JB7 TaxID=2962887 RepID=UPI0020C9DC54|nr:hypothetical protein [Lewinella sp. JB7]MCP9237004.1 hypothetical protein [Lewinella sp. JB7]